MCKPPFARSRALCNSGVSLAEFKPEGTKNEGARALLNLSQQHRHPQWRVRPTPLNRGSQARQGLRLQAAYRLL